MSKAEKFIQDCTRNRSNQIAHWDIGGKNVKPIYSRWLTPDETREAVEIARKEMIERACMYLNEHRNGVIDDEYIINLNKAMKDE